MMTIFTGSNFLSTFAFLAHLSLWQDQGAVFQVQRDLCRLGRGPDDGPVGGRERQPQHMTGAQRMGAFI